MSPFASALDVQWILQEPCLVTWEDSNRELRTLGLEPHPTTLWVGVNNTERTWAVMLQRTIAFQYARRFKPSDFFVFLDPRGLQIENEPITNSHTLNDLLYAHQNSTRNSWLGGRVSLGQLQTPGRVLMRQRLPEDKAWEGMPLHLLMEIQSLSRASEFNIYVRNKKTVRGVVNRLRHELPKTLALLRIDLDKAFDGRGGAWDAWGLYSRELVGLQKLGSSRSPVAPPSYSVDDPNAARTSQSDLASSSLKRPNTSQGVASSQKRVKDDRASQWEWYKVNFPLGSPTEENTPSSTRDHLSRQSTVGDQIFGDVQSSREDDPLQTAHSPHLDKSFQGHYSPSGRQLTPVTPRTPENNHLHDLQGTQTPPYTASISATSTASLDQLNIRPTVFTTRPQAPPSSTITLTLADLERLISTAIKAQIPAIAAEVQTRALATELTAWAEPSISDYITTHMPAIMQDAVAAYVSDVNDEFDSASAALHEVKDEATTEIKSIEGSTTQAIHQEYQVAVQDLQEQSQRLSEALDDKCTELEDRLDAKMTSSAPPGYSRLAPATRNSTKEAVKLFERSHRGHLTPEEQVRVLLSIAKFSNAEVFVAADLESRKMLIAHWSGKRTYIPPSSQSPCQSESTQESTPTSAGTA